MKFEIAAVVVAQAHTGDQLKTALQLWIGPIFLAIVGGKALALFFGEEGKMSRALQLFALAVVGAMFIYVPEIFKTLGTWLSTLL